MDREAIQHSLRKSAMKERTPAVVAIEATDAGESAALQDFVANELVGIGFSKVIDRLTITRNTDRSQRNGVETPFSVSGRPR